MSIFYNSITSNNYKLGEDYHFFGLMGCLLQPIDDELGYRQVKDLTKS